MSGEIILGITPVDPIEHVVTGRYASNTDPSEPGLVEVIEVAHCRLGHTVVEGSNPVGRLAVFSRFVTMQELDVRQARYDENPDTYVTTHLTSL